MSGKRALPSWTSSRETKTSSRKNQTDASENDASHGEGSGATHSHEITQDNFSVLLEGVVFVLSGFVNPERSTLRSQALEMGAEYRADWTSDCTLLVCAFPNTPKFRQVQSDGGTIVSKEWISECFNQKKLVDIEPYLMHAGKPWRITNDVSCNGKLLAVQKTVLPEEPDRKAKRGVRAKLTGPAVHERRVGDHFSPTNIKEWAADDLRTTIAWLESQEERPKKNELNAIAAQGILTCLQDAIESLRQKQDVRTVTEQWMFVPRVVKELAELDGRRNTKGSLSQNEVSELASTCKKIYEEEFSKFDGSTKSKKLKTNTGIEGEGVQNISDDAEYDSDQTVEMTEDEIELACDQLT